MAESLFSADGQDGPADLISFLKAIPDGRYRRGVRYPQWFLLLVAVLGILSPRFQERCHPVDPYTRGLEDMTNASLQRGRQG